MKIRFSALPTNKAVPVESSTDQILSKMTHSLWYFLSAKQAGHAVSADADREEKEGGISPLLYLLLLVRLLTLSVANVFPTSSTTNHCSSETPDFSY